MTLKQLQIGESAVIESVGGQGALRQHFLDMGMIPGVEVTVVKFAPMGDPMEIQLHGYELTLRLEEADQIEISRVTKTNTDHKNTDHMKKNGRVVLLTAKPETIYERVKDSDERPILNDHMNVEFISSLMDKRKERYEAVADITVATDGKNVTQICEEIISKLIALDNAKEEQEKNK